MHTLTLLVEGGRAAALLNIVREFFAKNNEETDDDAKITRELLRTIFIQCHQLEINCQCAN